MDKIPFTKWDKPCKKKGEASYLSTYQPVQDFAHQP